MQHDLDSLALRAKFARALLLAYAAVNALLTPLPFVQPMLARNIGDPRGFLIAIGIFAFADLLTLLGLVVTVPLWVYRAHANLSGAGLRHSPVWAALSFFVPIVGLIVPFLAMRQIYNRSMGEDEYQLNAGVADVSSWWGCYVAGVLVGSFLVMTALFNLNGLVFIVTPRVVTQTISIFDSLLLIGAALFLWRIIGTVTRAQQGLTNIAEAFA
jgi:hypothetical protein